MNKPKIFVPAKIPSKELQELQQAFPIYELVYLLTDKFEGEGGKE